MANWKKWIWPGIITVAVLTLAANWLRGTAIEEDLAGKAGKLISQDHPWATIEADRRDLTIKGFAPNPEAATSAHELASGAYDVRIVTDGSEPLAAVSPYTLDISRSRRNVILSGHAPDHQTRDAIAKAVKKAVKRAKIENNLELASGAPEGLMSAVEYSLGAMSELDESSAKLSDKAISLDGTAASLDDFETVAATLSNVPEGYELATNGIIPPAVSPYRWSISKRGTGITLRGNVPSSEAQAGSLADAQQLFGDQPVTDRQTLASGDPEGADAVRSLLQRLVAKLDAGQGNMIDKTISISGRVEDPELASSIENELLENLPENFAGTTNILIPVEPEPEPPLASPFVWSVEKTEEGAAVSGNVSSEEISAANIELVKSALGTQDVANNQTLARGAPDGIQDVRKLIVGQLRFMLEGNASISDQAVTITGKVKNKNIAGLLNRTLENRLPDGYSGAAELDFPEAEKQVAKPIEVKPPVASPFVWSVEKSSDGVTVSGNVSSDDVAAKIIEDIKRGFNVADVIDQQTVARGSPEGMALARKFAISQLKFLEEGKAQIEDQAISVSGKSKNKNLAGLVERSVANRLPDGFTGSVDVTFPQAEVVVAKAVVVKPPVASPFRWSVSKLPSGVTVLGNVSSQAIADATVDQIKNRFSVAKVVDKQTIALGAPDGLDDVRRMLIDQVRLLEAGQANIIDSVVSVTGKAKNKNIRNLVDRTVTGKLPEGFTGSTNIVVPITEVIQGAAPSFSINQEDTGQEAAEVEQSAEVEVASVEPETNEAEPVQAVEVCQQNIVEAVNGRKIQFETARAIIKSESKPIIDDVVKVALECPQVRFEIGGHTDSRGRDSYNLELSRARAKSVVKYMSDAGVNPDQLTARGFGETAPLEDNSTSQGRAKNRRIEFTVIQ